MGNVATQNAVLATPKRINNNNEFLKNPKM